MKKLYTLALCLSVFGWVSGQNNSPNVESFELPDLPQCWTSIDADGDTFEWSPFYAVDDGNGGFIPGNTGNGAVTSASFINGLGAVTPDNYLVLPQLDVQDGEHLTYYVAGLDPDWSAEKYAVVLSTGGNAAADFTVTLFEETLSSADFQVRDVDLSDYVGQQIYIAFRHYDITDQFQMRIDDVQYPTTVEDCPILVSVEDNQPEVTKFEMFPNPTTGITMISLPAIDGQLIEVYNLSGQLVHSENAQSNSGNVSMDLSHLSKGIYTVTVTSTDAIYTSKLSLK